jgi:casein kinase I homolog HRR25
MVKELTNIKILGKLSQGAFGEIYECIDENTGRTMAIKIERKPSVCQLRHEYLIYEQLKHEDMPAIYDFGRMEFKDSFVSCMTMDLLGLSLEKLFNKLDKTFSIKTIFMIGKRALKRIETLHKHNYVHRDIKPDNFITDLSGKNVYIIDFGLSKEYRNPTTLVHRPIRTDKNLTGTARFASVNTHQGIEQSRRDDIESLGYMLIYFFRKRLPWQGLRAETKYEKYAKIRGVKESTSIYELCEDLPNEIYLYMIQAKQLEYEDAPNYEYLISLFESGLRSRGMQDDGLFDWLIKNETKSKD